MSSVDTLLGELMLYFADKSVGDPKFGRTKLNKLLFFSDFLAYVEHGRALTGAEYQKLEHGPAPRRLLPVMQRLKDQGAASEAPKMVGSYTQRRLIALRKPNLAQFTAEQISLVDDVLDTLRGSTAVDVSGLSHVWSRGWGAVDEGETIPYETALVGPSELTAWDLDVGVRIAKEIEAERAAAA